MTQVWPVTVTLKAPDWIDGLVLPEQAVITTQFASRSESRLRLSSVQSGAEFTCWYHPISGNALMAFLNWFKLVDTFENFTLPSSPNFFALGCPGVRETLYRNASPTGRWRFKEKPQVSEIDLGGNQIRCQLISVID